MTAKKSTPEGSNLSRGRRGRVKIRTLRARDRERWILLRQQLWPTYDPTELAVDADTLLNTWDGDTFRRAAMPATVLLAELPSHQVIGFAEVDLRLYVDGCQSSPVGYLEGWFVSPEHRRTGVGRALVDGAENWARARGCTEMGSDTQLDNTGSQGAHRALGYEEVERMVHYRRYLDRDRPFGV